MDAPEMSFEEAFGRLEEIVARLEGGGLTVDEMVGLYEQGVALARWCRERLAAAQARVVVLARDVDDLGDGVGVLDEVDDLQG